MIRVGDSAGEDLPPLRYAPPPLLDAAASAQVGTGCMPGKNSVTGRH